MPAEAAFSHGMRRSPRPVAKRRGAAYLGAILAVFLFGRIFYRIYIAEYSTSFLDEILVVLLGVVAPFGIGAMAKSTSGIRFIMCFLLYAALVIWSSYAHPYSFERGSQVLYTGFILDVKFFVLFFGAYALALHAVHIDGAKKTMTFILWALLLVALLNSVQVIRDIWTGIGLDGEQLAKRGPFFRPEGFLFHPVLSAQVILFGFLATLALIVRRATPSRFFFAAFLFVMLIIHVSVRDIIVGCLALMLFVIQFLRSDAFTKSLGALCGVAIVGLVFASAAGEQITGRIAYYTSDQGEDSVRRVLYSASVDIANDMAPLGAGSSTFGSQGSRTNGYSSLYFTYGVYGRWGASKDNDRFLLDTFWPKILAETGYIGLFFFFFTVTIPVVCAFRCMITTQAPEDAFILASLVGVLIMSVGGGVLGEEYAGVLFYTLGAIALARASVLLPRERRKRKKRPRRPHDDPSFRGRPAMTGRLVRQSQTRSSGR